MFLDFKAALSPPRQGRPFFWAEAQPVTDSQALCVASRHFEFAWYCQRSERQPVVTAEKLRRARAFVAKGLTVRDAAVRLKVGKTVLYEALGKP